VFSTNATSATLSWVPMTAASEYILMAVFMGPCTDALVPPRNVTVRGGRGFVAGLEEFSSYVAMVTAVGGVTSTTVPFTTDAAGESYMSRWLWEGGRREGLEGWCVVTMMTAGSERLATGHPDQFKCSSAGAEWVYIVGSASRRAISCPP
jgi:hypothetical protein